MSNVNLKFNSQLDKNILRYKSYDKIILSTYKNNNQILKKLGYKIKNKFRYELVEKIGIKLPKRFKNISFVIMDGNFVCVDPYAGTQYHLLRFALQYNPRAMGLGIAKTFTHIDFLTIDQGQKYVVRPNVWRY